MLKIFFYAIFFGPGHLAFASTSLSTLTPAAILEAAKTDFDPINAAYFASRPALSEVTSRLQTQNTLETHRRAAEVTAEIIKKEFGIETAIECRNLPEHPDPKKRNDCRIGLFAERSSNARGWLAQMARELATDPIAPTRARLSTSSLLRGGGAVFNKQTESQTESEMTLGWRDLRAQFMSLTTRHELQHWRTYRLIQLVRKNPLGTPVTYFNFVQMADAVPYISFFPRTVPGPIEGYVDHNPDEADGARQAEAASLIVATRAIDLALATQPNASELKVAAARYLKNAMNKNETEFKFLIFADRFFASAEKHVLTGGSYATNFSEVLANPRKEGRVWFSFQAHPNMEGKSDQMMMPVQGLVPSNWNYSHPLPRKNLETFLGWSRARILARISGARRLQEAILIQANRISR
jgi:hypothetical protein